MANIVVDEFGNPVGRPDLYQSPLGPLQGILSKLFQPQADAGPSGNVGILGFNPSAQPQIPAPGPQVSAQNPNLVPVTPPQAPPIRAPQPVSAAEPVSAAPQQAPLSDLDRLSIALHNFQATPGLIPGIVDAIRGYEGGPSLAATVHQVTDLAGNPTFMAVDPVTQTFKEMSERGTTGGSAGSVNSPTIREAMKMQPEYDANGRDQKFLSALDPVSRRYTEAVLNGDATTVGRNLQRFLPIATRAEKNFTGETYQARVRGAVDESSGKTSELMRATRQSAEHFGDLIKDTERLPGHQMPLANWAQNWYETNLGGKGYQTTFEINAHALADELAKMWKGSGISDAEIRAWESRISPDMSRETQRDVMGKLLELYQASFRQLEQKRKDELGPANYAKKGPLITPEVQAALDKVNKFAHGGQQQGGVQTTQSGIRWSVGP